MTGLRRHVRSNRLLTFLLTRHPLRRTSEHIIPCEVASEIGRRLELDEDSLDLQTYAANAWWVHRGCCEVFIEGGFIHLDV